jgi:hypothetical protein
MVARATLMRLQGMTRVMEQSCERCGGRGVTLATAGSKQ